MVKGQLVADVLNSQHAGTGATWRINTKILSTCRGWRHIVSPRAQLVCEVLLLFFMTSHSVYVTCRSLLMFITWILSQRRSSRYILHSIYGSWLGIMTSLG